MEEDDHHSNAARKWKGLKAGRQEKSKAVVISDDDAEDKANGGDDEEEEEESDDNESSLGFEKLDTKALKEKIWHKVFFEICDLVFLFLIWLLTSVLNGQPQAQTKTQIKITMYRSWIWS